MYEATPGDQPGFEMYLDAIRARKWVVLGCTLVGLLLGWFMGSTATEQYTASAKVVVYPENPDSFNKVDLAAESAVMRSQVVLADAAKKLDPQGTPDELFSHSGVKYQPDTQVMSLSYTSTNAARARDAAKAIAESYVNTKENERSNKYTAQLKSYNDQIIALTAEISQLSTKISEQQVIASNVANSQAARDEATRQSNQLQQQISDAQFRLRDLRSKALDTQTTAANRPPSALLTTPPTLPSSPDGFSSNLLLVLGAFAGLIIGVVAAFVLDRLDRRARTSGDVEVTLGTPVLAAVPSFGRGNTGPGAAVVMLRGGDSKKLRASRESYRRIRSSLEFLLKRTGTKSVLVTSARPGEGKSVTATNLAIAAAQAGRKVVLVSADLHRPTVERLLSIPSDHGLADWLRDDSDILLHEVEGVPNLTVVPCGHMVENTNELFASSRFTDLVHQLEATFDLVVIDTPPILATADVTAIASHVGGVLVVTDGRRTDADDLQQVRGALELVGGRLVGAVLNRATSRSGRFGRDDYSYRPIAPSRSA